MFPPSCYHTHSPCFPPTHSLRFILPLSSTPAAHASLSLCQNAALYCYPAYQLFFPPLNKNTPSGRVCVCFKLILPGCLKINSQTAEMHNKSGEEQQDHPTLFWGGGVDQWRGPLPPNYNRQRGHFNGGLGAFPLVLGTPFVLLPLTPRQTPPPTTVS